MYKLLIFLKVSNDNNLLTHFKETTIPLLSKIAGEEVKIAKVENSLMFDSRFDYFCEVSAESKDKMDEKMGSKSGKELMRDLADFHKNINFLFINYEGLE
ncbi:MAG: hypothetical protein IPH11_01260 [Ignavibacteriales bacterium]|nr:hypothetical protein [Ignavibacteriales bacterium]